MKRVFHSTIALVILLGLQFPAAYAGVNSPISMNLVASKLTYTEGEPIILQISVQNNSGQQTIIGEGFWNLDFATEIVFISPDKKSIVRSIYKGAEAEPGPPKRYKRKDCTPVDLIPAQAGHSKPLDDATQYYKFSQLGTWTGRMEIPLTLFSRYEVDEYGVNIGCIDDPLLTYFNPLFSNEITFEIVPAVPEPKITSTIQVEVMEFKVGHGSHPGVKKEHEDDVPVHLIRISDIPEDYHPINWKTYSEIFENVVPYRSGKSNHKGIVKFQEVPRDDYLILSYYDKAHNFNKLGEIVSADDPGWLTDKTIKVRLVVMEKKDKKKCAGKSHRRDGSELWIIEPEFVEWSDTVELYPIVLDSEGDWVVVTKVVPPEGFVTDTNALTAEVVDTISAVQFTVTDVGSAWVETEIVHDITHYEKTDTERKNPRKEIIRDKIGVKLSKEFAKKKGLSVYGHTEGPGPFVGGKKVKNKEKIAAETSEEGDYEKKAQQKGTVPELKSDKIEKVGKTRRFRKSTEEKSD